MRITLDDLTVRFDHLDPKLLLEDWRWLIGSSKHPVLVSAIGDAFVQEEADSTIFLLDTAAGTCTPVASDLQSLRALLSEAEWVMDHLAADAVADFLSHGLRLGPGEVYSWRRPPVLGGEYELANIERTDIAVHFSTTGQIHRQVHDLPAGTAITEVRAPTPPES